MALATYNVAGGLFLTFQDRDIWGLPVYDTAKELPGSPPSWGVLMFLAGLMIFAGMGMGKHVVLKCGAALGGLWNFFFAITLADEVYKGSIGAQPIVLYGFLVLGHIIVFYTYKGSNALHKTEA